MSTRTQHPNTERKSVQTVKHSTHFVPLSGSDLVETKQQLRAGKLMNLGHLKVQLHTSLILYYNMRSTLGGGAGLYWSPEWICRYFPHIRTSRTNFCFHVPEGTVLDSTRQNCFCAWRHRLYLFSAVDHSSKICQKLQVITVKTHAFPDPQ